MIQKRLNKDDYPTDEEFAKMLEPLEKVMFDLIKKDLCHEFFAYYLANAYKLNVIWSDSSLEYEYLDVRDYLPQLPSYEFVDLQKLNSIMQKKYSLRITDSNPIKIKEISAN